MRIEISLRFNAQLQSQINIISPSTINSTSSVDFSEKEFFFFEVFGFTFTTIGSDLRNPDMGGGGGFNVGSH